MHNLSQLLLLHREFFLFQAEFVRQVGFLIELIDYLRTGVIRLLFFLNLAF